MKKFILFSLISAFIFTTSCDNINELLYTKDYGEKIIDKYDLNGSKYEIIWYNGANKFYITQQKTGEKVVYPDEASIPLYPVESLRNRYQFVGWNTNSDLASQGIVGDDVYVGTTTIKMYAVYGISKHSIFFYNGYKLFHEEKEIVYNTTINISDIEMGTPVKNQDNKNKYKFLGWSKTRQKSDIGNNDLVNEVLVTEPTNLYACYEAMLITITVTFMNNNKEILKQDVPLGNVIKFDSKVIPTKAETTKFKYKFIGWSNKKLANDVGTSEDIVEYIAEKDIVLHAIFEEIEK